MAKGKAALKLFYDLWYRFGKTPWEVGPREELVQLVESGRITPCRAIDLGCGTGDNAIFLVRHGFEVTGIDYAPSAIAKARRKAGAAGVEAQFDVDDLTNLRREYGTFDLLVDYGTLDDLGQMERDRYVTNLLLLTRPGSLFPLWCFEWRLRWWERILTRILPFGSLALAPGEAHRRFGRHFEIECIAGESNMTGWPRGFGAYLMVRKSAGLLGRALRNEPTIPPKASGEKI